MEHRSLKIVDDFGYELATSHNTYNDEEFTKLQREVNTIPDEIREIELKIKKKQMKTMTLIYLNSLKKRLTN